MHINPEKKLLLLFKWSKWILSVAGGERVSGIKTLGINADLEMITIQVGPFVDQGINLGIYFECVTKMCYLSAGGSL